MQLTALGVTAFGATALGAPAAGSTAVASSPLGNGQAAESAVKDRRSAAKKRPQAPLGLVGPKGDCLPRYQKHPVLRRKASAPLAAQNRHQLPGPVSTSPSSPHGVITSAASSWPSVRCTLPRGNASEPTWSVPPSLTSGKKAQTQPFG